MAEFIMILKAVATYVIGMVFIVLSLVLALWLGVVVNAILGIVVCIVLLILGITTIVWALI